ANRLVGETTIQQAEMGDVSSFKQPYDLAPGLSKLTVRAEVVGGPASTFTYAVKDGRPLYRSPWLYLGLGILTGAALGVFQLEGLRRRNRLRTRRFNPYVAGAPVLKDDLFLGREALLGRILQTIHNNSIMLYGERRIGKTSLQHNLKKRLKQ